ncbi:MAG: multiheme c-type cytochrome ExtKL, partial [Caldimicrobium sp.]
REIKAKEIEVTVRLWHLPSAAAENLDKLVADKDKFLFFEEKRRVKIN